MGRGGRGRKRERESKSHLGSSSNNCCQQFAAEAYWKLATKQASSSPCLSLSLSPHLSLIANLHMTQSNRGAKATAQSTKQCEEGQQRGAEAQSYRGRFSLLSCVVHRRKLYGNQDHASIMTSDNENLLLRLRLCWLKMQKRKQRKKTENKKQKWKLKLFFNAINMQHVKRRRRSKSRSEMEAGQGGHVAGGSAHRACSNPDQLHEGCLPHRPDKCQRLKMQQQQQQQLELSI